MVGSRELHDLLHGLLEKRFEALDEKERGAFLTLAKRYSVARNVATDFEARRSVGDRLADRVASFGGSWSFILLFGAALLFWVVANTIFLSARTAIDPYPFIFLNLILSMVAAIQAPIIMMSQNRQAERDRLAAANDYDVNIKAEIEIMALHEKLDRMRLANLCDLVERQNEEIKALRALIEARRPATT